MRLLAPALTLAVALLAVSCDDDPARRVAAVFSWKRDGSQASLARIRALLADPDPAVRAAALDALVSSATTDAAQSAIAALDDPDPSVRAVAAKGLGELREPSVEPRLIQLLQGDPVAQVRRRAAEALELVGGAAAASAMAEALADPSRDVRLAATRGCARLQSADCFESLARVILDDPEWDIRVAAARGLGRSGRSQAAEVLASANGDPNEFVRAAAASALASVPRATPPPPGEEPASGPGSAAGKRTRPAAGPPRSQLRGNPRPAHRLAQLRGVYFALRSPAADVPFRRDEIQRAPG